MPVARCGREPQRGFTYIGLLISVFLLGLALSSAGVVWKTNAQRERERELMFIGREFRSAIASFYAAGGRQFPQQLGDLLEDKRGGTANHHLRRLYADPMTGRTDWMVIRADALGIIGVASSSQQKPIKKGGFIPGEESFEDAETYRDWKFIFVPRNSRRLLIANPQTNQ